MSMISAQIDELRELAGDGSMEWVAGPISASVLREAADTIWQLRDDLQQANAENEKLREERDTYRTLVGPMDHQDFIVQLHTENFKLRYLAADMLKAMRHMEENTFMNVKVSYSRWFAPKLHELGIEVDE